MSYYDDTSLYVTLIYVPSFQDFHYYVGRCLGRDSARKASKCQRETLQVSPAGTDIRYLGRHPLRHANEKHHILSRYLQHNRLRQGVIRYLIL